MMDPHVKSYLAGTAVAATISTGILPAVTILSVPFVGIVYLQIHEDRPPRTFVEGLTLSGASIGGGLTVAALLQAYDQLFT